jgi:hypothetical protein
MPRNLAINIIINSMQTLLNADSLTVNIMQDQRNIRLVIMTAIDRHFNYFIQYQTCIIVTVQYHDNKETLFLTHIDPRSLYYFLDERFRFRNILTTGSCIIFYMVGSVLDTID